MTWSVCKQGRLDERVARGAKGDGRTGASEKPDKREGGVTPAAREERSGIAVRSERAWVDGHHASRMNRQACAVSPSHHRNFSWKKNAGRVAGSWRSMLRTAGIIASRDGE